MKANEPKRQKLRKAAFLAVGEAHEAIQFLTHCRLEMGIFDSSGFPPEGNQTSLHSASGAASHGILSEGTDWVPSYGTVSYTHLTLPTSVAV